MSSKARQLVPRLGAVGGLEEGCVLDARVNGIGVFQGGLEMPDTLELPGMRRAVVPDVGARRALVLELIPGRLPALATVVRSLKALAEPAAGLGCAEAVGICRCALEGLDLPTR